VTNWIDLSSELNPPINRPIIVYCPEWSDTGYEIVTWNGGEFECETHGFEVSKHVQRWALFMEAD
jgi:hypothetical protein